MVPVSSTKGPLQDTAGLISQRGGTSIKIYFKKSKTSHIPVNTNVREAEKEVLQASEQRLFCSL